MPVDSAEFRRALGHFASEVTVVSTNLDGQKLGITVTSFCSLSLEPPLVLICIDCRSKVHDPLRTAGNFAVNFLAAEQEHVSRRFAAHDPDPFADVASVEGKLGLPLVADALAVVECRTVQMLPGGDHTIFVGQVEATHVAGGEPLMYFHGKYRRLAP